LAWELLYRGWQANEVLIRFVPHKRVATVTKEENALVEDKWELFQELMERSTLHEGEPARQPFRGSRRS
jgi:hypothetical protein